MSGMLTPVFKDVQEIPLPIWDAHTLPGSVMSWHERPDGKVQVSMNHVRPLNAPRKSLYTAKPHIQAFSSNDIDVEARMARARRQAEALMRQMDRGIDPRVMNDVATAVNLRGNWLADGTTFTNSTTENVIGYTTSLQGTGAAIETITSAAEATAGFWAPGRTIRIYAEIVVSSAASAQGNLTMNWRLDSHTGATVGGVSATNALVASMSSIVWQAELWLVCRTIGTAGTLEGSSDYQAVLSTTQTTAPATSINGAHNAAIDTTANHNICLTVLFSAASASNIVGIRQFIAEVLN